MYVPRVVYTMGYDGRFLTRVGIPQQLLTPAGINTNGLNASFEDAGTEPQSQRNRFVQALLGSHTVVFHVPFGSQMEPD